MTFKLSDQQAQSARSAALVGEFNNWSPDAMPMRKLKNGAFTTTIDLEQGKKYCFKYLVDDQRWENDDAADEYAYCDYAQADNSVVEV